MVFRHKEFYNYVKLVKHSDIENIIQRRGTIPTTESTDNFQ